MSLTPMLMTELLVDERRRELTVAATRRRLSHAAPRRRHGLLRRSQAA